MRGSVRIAAFRGRVFAGAAVACVLLVPTATASAAGWSVQSAPEPAGSSAAWLNAVSCVSQTACVAVGGFDRKNGDLPLVERWNGIRWSVQATPPLPSYGQFNGVSCTSKSACTAVGYSGCGLLAERWDGKRWSLQATPPGSWLCEWNLGSEDGQLNAVSCVSGTACTAVGTLHKYETGAADISAKPAAGGDSYAPIIGRWNGTKWLITARDPSGFHDTQLDGVSCTSSTACTTVGGGASMPYSGVDRPVVKRWNGNRWLNQQAVVDGVFSKLHAVSCTSRTACMAVGQPGYPDYSPLAEQWDGTRWSLRPVALPVGAENPELTLDSVSCNSATACTAVGSVSSLGYGLAERWDGITWTVQTPAVPSPGFYSFSGASCASRRTCIAVGRFDQRANAPLQPAHILVERWSGK